MSAVYERSQPLARNLAFLTNGKRAKKTARALKADRTLQILVADLVAARRAVGMTQEGVAARMWTTISVISRLENGAYTRPTLSTIEKYAPAVGALAEIPCGRGDGLRALIPDARS
jgi:ribosome-binding protein aMBF1 (putative translation factor)